MVKTLDEFKMPAADKTELLNILGGYKKEIIEKAGDTKTGAELPTNFKPAPPLKK